MQADPQQKAMKSEVRSQKPAVRRSEPDRGQSTEENSETAGPILDGAPCRRDGQTAAKPTIGL
jgi:hypothetical protein